MAVEGAGVMVFASEANHADFSTRFTAELSIRSNGTLLVNNTFAVNQNGEPATVQVANTGQLGGSGTVGRGTTVESGAKLSPGSAADTAGVLTFTNGLTLDAGSQFQFELKENTVSGRGTAFDGVNVSGGALTVAEGAIFNLTFNGAGSTVNFLDEFWSTNQEWLVFENANAATVGAFTLGTPSVDSEGNAFETTGGVFGFMQNGNHVYLTYTAVPEPNGVALLLGAGGALIIGLRRRMSKGA